MRQWIIKAGNEYWNNELGWTYFSKDATVFDNQNDRLPIHAEEYEYYLELKTPNISISDQEEVHFLSDILDNLVYLKRKYEKNPDKVIDYVQAHVVNISLQGKSSMYEIALFLCDYGADTKKNKRSVLAQIELLLNNRLDELSELSQIGDKT